MLAPRPLVAALLLAPSILVSGAESWLVRHARVAGETLGGAVSALVPTPAPAETGERTPIPEPAPLVMDEGTSLSEAPNGNGKKARSRRRPGAKEGPPAGAATVPRGLFVDERTVFRLAMAGSVPSGTPVPPTTGRPGGLLLRGVAGLGIGLLEGDVLAEVEGRPVRTEGQVIAAVIVARAHRVPRMSARFFRGTDPWWLTVEMPYLPNTHPPMPAAGANPPESGGAGGAGSAGSASGARAAWRRGDHPRAK